MSAPEDHVTPYVHGYGPPVESASAAVSPAWPPHQADDIGLLIVESGGWPVSLTVPAGFVEVTGSPQNAGVSGTASGTQLSVYWKRATGSAEGPPTVGFVANHIRAQIITVRDVIASGNPWEASAGNFTLSATTSVSLPGLTTTKQNTLFMGIVSHSADSAVMRHSNWANSSLTELSEKLDDASEIGSGSGFAIITGKKQAAGVISDTTAQNNLSSQQGRISLAIKAAADITLHSKMSLVANIKPATLRIARLIVADKLAFSATMKDANFAVGTGYVLQAQKMSVLVTLRPVTFTKRFGRWKRKDARPSVGWTKRVKEE